MMMIESTLAKIGRSMKNREKLPMAPPLFRRAGRRRFVAGDFVERQPVLSRRLRRSARRAFSRAFG